MLLLHHEGNVEMDPPVGVAPTSTCFTARIPGENRSDDDEKTGTLPSFASRKISMVSRSEPPTGLSMNTGFREEKTRLAWSRCTRPSTLSI